jgi:hypothetical protein
MSEALYILGARLYRVLFLGIKWSIPSADPPIDQLIRRYRVQMRSFVQLIRRYRVQMRSFVLSGKNLFDSIAQYTTDAVQLFKFSN